MMILSASVARLRDMVAADLDRVLIWRNHPLIRQHMYTRAEISLDVHTQWFEKASADANRHLLILEVNGESLGYVSFQCDTEKAAVWGFYLAPEAPKGTGRLLGETMTSYAFDTLGLERLWGEVMPENVASQNFHLRQGFVLDSVLSNKKMSEQKLGHVHRYLLTKDAARAHQGTKE